MAAPVVPMKEAITPPRARKIVLFRGVALMSPERKIPPLSTKRASSRMMNWPYSTSAWTTSTPAPAAMNQTAMGTPSSRATVSFSRLRSQACAVAGTSGSTAMQASSVTNGIMLHH